MKTYSIALFVAVSALLTSSGARGTTLYVSQGNEGTPPYLTDETAAGSIQEAVDAAQYGDVVSIGPGDYTERVRLRDGILLWGSGSDSTMIHNPSDDYSAVIVGAPDAEIRDLAVVSPQHPDCPWCGGTGIYLGPWAGQLVSECAVTGPFQVGIACEGTVYGTPAIIRRCVVEGASTGVRMRGLWGDCIVDNCRIRAEQGCGIKADCGRFGTLRIMRSTITGGISGVHVLGQWRVSVESCTLEHCGVHALLGADCAQLVVWNTVISHSLSGVVADDSTIEMSNCTIAENRTGLSYRDCQVLLVNTILWGAEVPIDPSSGPSLTAKFSDIQGGNDGEGNIDADPLFVNPSAADFRLRPSSPCIDTGSSSENGVYCHPVWSYAVDRAGHNRGAYGGITSQIDMGAYEYYINEVSLGPGEGETTLTWSSRSGKTYSIFYSRDLLIWHVAVADFPSTGSMTTSWTDDGSKTGVPPSLVPRRFYRILENP